MTRKPRSRRWTAVPIWCIFAVAQIQNAKTAQAQKAAPPDSTLLAAEKEAFKRVCGACHSIAMIDTFRSEPDWRETVENMIQTGAKGSDKDFENVMGYLARNWTKIDINSATGSQIAAALGVKEELGAAIVKYRAHHEPFTTMGDLKKVPGMAQVDIESRSDRITFSNAAEKRHR